MGAFGGILIFAAVFLEKLAAELSGISAKFCARFSFVGRKRGKGWKQKGIRFIIKSKFVLYKYVNYNLCIFHPMPQAKNFLNKY